MGIPSAQSSPLLLPFQIWSHLRYQLMWAYDGPVAEGHSDVPYRGTPQGAWLLRQGELRLTFPDGVEHFRAPTWVFPRSQPGWQTFSVDAKILSIRFRAAWPGGEPIFTLTRSLVAPTLRNGVLERRARTLVRLLRHRPELSRSLRPSPTELKTHVDVLSALHHWMSAYVRFLLGEGLTPNAPRTTDSRVTQAVEWLEHWPFSQPWSERDLANHVHLSISQLNRLFMRNLNTTPLAMRERLRLEAAQQFLAEEHRSIKAIAYQLGFSSPGNFSTWFRKRTGTPPRQWRTGASSQ